MFGGIAAFIYDTLFIRWLFLGSSAGLCVKGQCVSSLMQRAVYSDTPLRPANKFRTGPGSQVRFILPQETDFELMHRNTGSGLTRWPLWCQATGLSQRWFWRWSRGSCSSFWSSRPWLWPGLSRTPPSLTRCRLSHGLRTQKRYSKCDIKKRERIKHLMKATGHYQLKRGQSWVMCVCEKV